jgi:sulfate/thiosulfate transport system ATP-binding protein
MSIEVRNIRKTFGSYVALDDVTLSIPNGALVALLGPSGCGKTTLLRIIAGLESPDPGSGAILFHDEDMTDRAATERRVGFVFQHYSLFRHMTIFDNVAFGLQVRPRNLRPTRKEISSRVSDLLRLVQLDHVADRYPWQLSGGQRQRVALVRSLAVEPRILLLDEPFGALDAKVRKELRRWLRRLHDETGLTSLFVTHDQEEALEVSDRVAVMNKGRIEQVGSPQEVYDHPANAFVFGFLGSVNLFHGRVHEGSVRIGEIALPAGSEGSAGPGNVVAYVRPHDIHVEGHRNGESSIPVRVLHINAAGSVVRVQLERGDTKETVEAELTRERFGELALAPGQQAFITLRNARVFAEDYTI